MKSISQIKQWNLLVRSFEERQNPFSLTRPSKKTGLIRKIRHLQKHQLAKLLGIAKINQLFPFNGELHQQTDSVAMGPPLGPLLANIFTCHIESQLEQSNMIPSFYWSYVDDTLAKMPTTESATEFLQVLKWCPPQVVIHHGIWQRVFYPFPRSTHQKVWQPLTVKQLTKDFSSIFRTTSTTIIKWA